MSEANLSVPTAFVDISQLAEGLADRVDEGRLMLYGPEAFEEGAWIRFEVLLADQTPALEGVGRVVTSIDGGEERPEVARWDVVLDSLRLEGRGDAVYERILMLRGGAFGDEPPTGELSLDEVEQVEEAALRDGARPGGEFADQSTVVAEAEHYRHHIDASAAEVHGDPPAAPYDESYAETGRADAGYAEPAVEPRGDAFDRAEATVVARADEYGEPAAEEAHAAQAPEEAYGYGPPAGEEPGADDDWAQVEPGDVGTGDVELGEVEDITSVPPPAPPQQPGGFPIAPFGANRPILSRPSRGASWYPEVVPPPESRPRSGLFAFAGGLPVPPAPPRPDLDPSLRIRPAPRPQNGGGPARPPEPEAAYAPPSQPLEATDPSFSTPDVTETMEGDIDEPEAGEARTGDSIPAEPADSGGVGDDEFHDPESTSVDTEAPDDPDR